MLSCTYICRARVLFYAYADLKESGLVQVVKKPGDEIHARKVQERLNSVLLFMLPCEYYMLSCTYICRARVMCYTYANLKESGLVQVVKKPGDKIHARKVQERLDSVLLFMLPCEYCTTCFPVLILLSYICCARVCVTRMPISRKVDSSRW